MKLTYETGVATLIQFIALSFLNVATGINSIATTCTNNANGCVSNILTSMIFFILITCWFGCVWLLGVAAQTRRSRLLAQALIGAELAIAFVAYFNIRHRNANDIISLITSLIDLLLALWIISLAVRLMLAKGGRVVTKQRARRRPQPRKQA